MTHTGISVWFVTRRSVALPPTTSHPISRPEICAGRPYGYKSDMWAVGCILYELAALRPVSACNNCAGKEENCPRVRVWVQRNNA
jgi:serine/threonine protein kinase